ARRDRGGGAGVIQLVLADTNFAEKTWILIVKPIAIFAFILGVTPMVLLLERKLMGRMQSRYGPNRVGPYGLLQPLADVIKLLTKEQFRPATSVGWLMAIAPMISILTAIMTVAIIPFADRGAWGHGFGVYGIDVPVGILYV